MVRRLAVALLVSLAGLGHAVPANAQKIDPPKKIKNVEPVYPASAQAARMQGEVVIEATVGTDGKVREPRVIGSIPLLDEAALTAVRQWEYEPAVVDGEPKAVIMTVRVKFSLSEAPPPQRTGPLVLDRVDGDWTIAGTPLLDDNLRFWLRDVMRREPEKQLFVRADPNGQYAGLVTVLASAAAAGADDLRLFVDDVEQSVRVWLEPTSEKVPGINLPPADVASAVKKAALSIAIPRSGRPAAAKASMQRAASGAVVRLRADGSRKISDVWDVIKPGSAARVEGIVLAVQLPSGAAAASNAPVSPQQQQDWSRVSDALSKIVLSDRPLDDAISASTPILEKFVTRNPNVLEAQFRLASAYEGRSLRKGTTAEARRHDLQEAVRHFALTAEFHDNADVRFLCTWKIAQLYGADQLSDAAQAQRYAQRLTEEFPSHAESHLFYATLLHDAGDVGGAANVLRHGRTVATMPVAGLLLSVQYLLEQVKGDRRLPPAGTRKLLDEAIAVADAIIALPEKSDTDYRLATMAKSMALDLEAERVARTSQERLALLVESERWGSPVDEHKNGAPPPPVKLSSADARDLEWNAVRRWNSSLADEGQVDSAIDAIGKYSTEHPDMPAPHAELASLLMRSAKGATDPAARARMLDRAATELQRTIDLAPPGPERRDAFAQLLDVTGPKNLNRLDRQESAARAMLKRQPQEPSVHYALAAVLLRSGKSADADKVLRNARSAIKPTTATRAEMASELLHTIRAQEELPDAAARRLFDEAAALLGEAEKLKGGTEDVRVIESRMGWLYLSADRFEKDPARAEAQRAEAKRLEARAIALREKGAT